MANPSAPPDQSFEITIEKSRPALLAFIDGDAGFADPGRLVALRQRGPEIAVSSPEDAREKQAKPRRN
ncbi:MAG TPA: hypothetical protein VHX65_01530 [Pirellulales bacterium]|nr:hypothetical protein [Pirellulales bacterium]